MDSILSLIITIIHPSITVLSSPTMKAYVILLLLSLHATPVSSFLTPSVASSSPNTKTTILPPPEVRPKTTTKLHLHVEPIHQHRDTIVRLDDPVKLEEKERPMIRSEEERLSEMRLRRFTIRLTPLVLALYLIGTFLSKEYPLETISG
mmetsp:Transcript_9367/g.19708  ORF Transcript_9367/g.19708 Transcript_9367/m.19708 type:complete len:149 (-) Transcript_9367:349-795(-)